jgi:hypothetical protein
MLALALYLALDARSVDGPDLIADVVNELEHGQGLFIGPIVWDLHLAMAG